MIPDKIYIAQATFPDMIDWDGSPINTKRIEKTDIEYIRKDALLEWAKELDQDAIRRAGDNDMACGYHYALTDLIDKLNSL